MREQELRLQFIMMGSAERGGLDSSAHQYYNMQVLHIKASLGVIKAVAAFKQNNLNYIFSANNSFSKKSMCRQFVKVLSYI